jgi:N utilization substance protein B
LGRKFARELLLKTLYQADLAKITHREALVNVLEELNPKDGEMQYIEDIVAGISQMEKLRDIDGLLARFAIDWPVKRISPVERAILRIAIFEMLFREDIPVGVSINEAVELGKKYSGLEAGRFINGVLSGINKDLQTTTPEG